MRRHPGHESDLRHLARALASARDADEVHDALEALLTPGERETIALRWRLVRLLAQGLSQRAVAAALGVSLCKITRGARELKDGPAGFRRMVRRTVRVAGERARSRA